MPALDPKKARELIAKRHPLYEANRIRWQWLLDSLEGGATYRDATYGSDARGMPLRNLVRHKREYPLPTDRNNLSGVWAPTVGQDSTALAGEDDYELRRARTVIPTVFERAIRLHISRIFSREIKRSVEIEEDTDGDAAADLKRTIPIQDAERIRGWWEDVDGSGKMPIDKWVRQYFAPVFFALGQLDVLFDRPRAPDGAKVETQADVVELGLDSVYAAIVLPDRILNWKCDCHCNYEWVLIEEVHEEDDGTECTYYRHWTSVDSTLYDDEGKAVESIPHGYGRPPIVRVFDKRDMRQKNIGRSSYEPIADLMRSIYNRASELVLSDTQQAHPILQAPESMLNSSEGVPVGPGWVLAMARSGDSWQGMEAVDLPKGSIDSLRLNIANDRSEADREAGLVKPAGSDSAATTAQSGLSKAFDYKEGNDLLAARAECLADAEREFVWLALSVILNRPIGRDEHIPVEITYPTEFGLLTAAEIVDLLDALDKATASVGTVPTLQSALMKRFARESLRGESDRFYEQVDEEIDAYVASKASARQQADESMSRGFGGMLQPDQPTPAEPDPTASDGQAEMDDTLEE